MVLRLMLVAILRFVLAGILIGAITSAVASQALAVLLFEMTPHDARVFAAVASLLLATATVATLPAARRAARLDAAATIRAD